MLRLNLHFPFLVEDQLRARPGVVPQQEFQCFRNGNKTQMVLFLAKSATPRAFGTEHRLLLRPCAKEWREAPLSRRDREVDISYSKSTTHISKKHATYGTTYSSNHAILGTLKILVTPFLKNAVIGKEYAPSFLAALPSLLFEQASVAERPQSMQCAFHSLFFVPVFLQR